MAIMAPAAFMQMPSASVFIRGLENLAVHGDLETRVGEILYGVWVRAQNFEGGTSLSLSEDSLTAANHRRANP